MKTKNMEILRHIALICTIAALVYLWFYNLYFDPNPEYGNRASTASNVGRDHWFAFIMWGVSIDVALLTNFLYSCKKFGIHQKLPKVFAWISTVGMIGFVLCKNEKFKRISWTFSFDQYTGPQKSDYSEQTLVSSQELFNGFISKKSLHSAFSVFFGVCFAIALMYLIIVKSRHSEKFHKLLIAFGVYVFLTAVLLKTHLSGTTELIAISVAMISMAIINNTDIMLDKDDPVPQQERQKVNELN